MILRGLMVLIVAGALAAFGLLLPTTKLMPTEAAEMARDTLDVARRDGLSPLPADERTRLEALAAGTRMGPDHRAESQRLVLVMLAAMVALLGAAFILFIGPPSGERSRPPV
jgi:hypothetical protein